MGGNQTQPRFSFGNIGQQQSPLNRTSETTSLLATPDTSSTPATAAANTSAGSVREQDEHEDFVPTAHFEPVIALPELVEVKTGEENEIVLFEHRAKLLRYVKESKEWKERGIGIMKVMAQKDDRNKVRLLMRREQVLKICCNQILTKDMKFNKMPNTETALTWFGQDYSDNELQVEMLAIRFKTGDICKQFLAAILAAQDVMGVTKPTKATTTTKTASTSGSTTKQSVASTGFGDKFKPKTGSWACDTCYVNNTAADKKCLSCGTVKDKGAATDAADSGAAKPAQSSVFSFGTLNNATKSVNEKLTTTTTTTPKTGTPSLAEQFKPKPGAWSCKACYTSNTADSKYCACCEEPKDDTIPKKGPATNLLASTGKLNF